MASEQSAPKLDWQLLHFGPVQRFRQVQLHPAFALPTTVFALPEQLAVFVQDK